MIKLLWKLFRKDFIRFYKEDTEKPISFNDMEFAFFDMEGRKYYRYDKSTSLPIDKFGRLQNLVGFMSAGISAPELNLMIDEADKALAEGLKDPRNAAKVGSILLQLRERQKLVIHTELLYNFIAIQLVREDENPALYDNEIHMQKVTQFKKEVEEVGAYTFFQLSELKNLYGLFSLSEKEWEIYWENSILEQLLLPERMKVYSSKTE